MFGIPSISSEGAGTLLVPANRVLTMPFLTGTLPVGVTFTRTTSATYNDANGSLAVALSGQPRFDCSLLTPVTNLMAYSEQFNQWSLTNVTTSLAATMAPNGYSVANLVIENTSNASHYVVKVPTNSMPAGVTYTASVYVKSYSNDRWIQMLFNNGTDGNFVGLTYDPIGQQIYGTGYSNGSYSATYIGNGWSRISITGTPTVANSALYIKIYNGTLGTSGWSYTGNGTSGLYIWGVQVEVGATSNQYVQTTSIAATQYQQSGLLIEPTRTNIVRNPYGIGLVPANGVELLTDGKFTLNPVASSVNTLQNGWYWSRSAGTIASAVWSSISASVALKGDGTNYIYFDTSFLTSIGSTYNISMNVGANPISVLVGTIQGANSIISTTTTIASGIKYQFNATSGTTWLTFANATTLTASISSVSVQSAGTMPTYWNRNTGNGLVITAIGNFTIAGVPVSRFSIGGVTTSTGVTNITYDTTSGSSLFSSIAVSAGVASSAYFEIVSGTLAGILGARVNFWNPLINVSLVSVVDLQTPCTLTSTLTRYSQVAYTLGSLGPYTMNTPSILLYPSAIGNTINVTLDIGAPQVEVGGSGYPMYASSVILPTAGSVYAATRSGDILKVNNLSSFYSGGDFTMMTEYDCGAATMLNSYLSACISNNGQYQVGTINSTYLEGTACISPAGFSQITTKYHYANTIERTAVALSSKRSFSALNGNSVSVFGNSTNNTNYNTLYLGGRWDGNGNQLGGHLRNFYFWNYALNKKQIEFVTSTAIDNIETAFSATQSTLPPTANWGSVVNIGSTFITMGNSNTNLAATSSDGINWYINTTPIFGSWILGNNTSLIVALSSNSNNALTSSNGITWTQQTLANSLAWSSVAWGGSLFVAIANGSSLANTSSNGITWTTRTLTASLSWSSIVYGGSLFVAVANNTSFAASSSNGITWTQRSLPSIAYWSSIGYNGSVFCAVKTNGIYTALSSDGINWTTGTLTATATWTSILGYNSLFVVISNSSLAATSTNGTIWSSVAIPSAQWNDIAWNGSKLAIIGSNTYGLYSTDGSTWSSTGIHGDSRWQPIAANNTIISVLGFDFGRQLTSTNGITWQESSFTPVNWYNSTIWGGSLFVAVGDFTSNVITSPDGINWTQKSFGATALSLYDIAYNGTSIFVAVQNTAGNSSSLIVTSNNNGATWGIQTLSSSFTWASIAYGGSLFAAIGQGYGPKTSSNGVSWAPSTISASFYFWNNMVYGSSLFVTFASGTSYYATSSNGTTWSLRTLAVSGDWAKAIYNTTSSLFCVITSNSNIAMVSSNGTTWTQGTLPLSGPWTDVAAKGSLFCAIGWDNMLATSSNGTIWSSILSPVNDTWSAITYNGSIFCALSVNNSAISTNGLAWTSSLIPVVGGWNTVVYGTSLFVATASDTAGVITSSDGLTWTYNNNISNVPYGAICWNGSIYCVSGTNGSNKCAVSSDGFNWTIGTLPLYANWNGITWNGSIFCAVAYATQTAATSPDGLTWTAQTLPIVKNWNGIAWNGSVFCAIAGYTATALTSPDGVNWTQQTLPNQYVNWVNIIWNGSVFIVTTSGNTISATSPDGVNWTIRYTPSFSGLQSSAWNGYIACSVGSGSQVFNITC